MAKSPAWQRKEGKSEKGGLNAKGRASYNAANPGKPGLKPPAPNPKTEKDANRRKSFCARSAGQMKQFPEAAKDPNSRLRKARKAWNC
jgi:hypothetical protein|tara:strand:- start:6222 stop:6485 length:264 start_codon:yes stop_codon:yes gene_type:complete